ncbi:cysteine--1-D-myo-inosityl 2-amino-2-deoxy-alpha-D-glucopyranoside ligase [Corynebacterium sp. NPDC060344]|uniref:cysteine--1-D-myo-inosityl 2-amino-2-deoxy-alpha-D-glucopyranoside ligase n=1 Tax=Corynebacterium sp. NPDC060344 TaxID=3347101 RepID=UPI0036547691
MHSWPIPAVPSVAGAAVPLTLHDTADAVAKPVSPGPVAGMYVCGITPYDATHLGHAATYLTFDLVYRVLLDNGHEVHYVQNITDVDDPLFERAERDGVDWRELGTSQIDLFRDDMKNLSVIPPRDYVGAIESVGEVVEMVGSLLASGAAYQLDDDFPDIYFDRTATAAFGYESNYDEATMAEFFAERGGDPERPGKRDPMDALLWRAEREGEPAWDAPFGRGRPGWHIECSAIAVNRLGVGFDIQGGGSDLAFPHHEFSAAHAEAATGHPRMAKHYVHSGMIALDGVKMSKSLGNLVFVSKLVAAGTDPSAIRLGVFAGHYRSDRDWSDEVLADAEARLARWRRAAAAASATDATSATVITAVREALSDDLDTPRALAAVDVWADAVLADHSSTAADSSTTSTDAVGLKFSGAGAEVAAALDALLGVKL